MKNLLLIAIFTIISFACKDEVEPVPKSEDLILEMKLIEGSHEGTWSSITINENRFIYQVFGFDVDENKNFEKSIDTIEFNKISKSVNINEFLELDSIIKSPNGEYPGSLDESVFILELILNTGTHTFECGSDSIPTIINNVKTKIYELHEKIKKD